MALPRRIGINVKFRAKSCADSLSVEMDLQSATRFFGSPSFSPVVLLRMPFGTVGWLLLPTFCTACFTLQLPPPAGMNQATVPPLKTDWMNNALHEIASFMVMRESTPWRWSHNRHQSDTIIVGRDPEMGVLHPPDIKGIIKAFCNLDGYPKYFRHIVLHAISRMSAEEKTYTPEMEFTNVYRNARIYAPSTPSSLDFRFIAAVSFRCSSSAFPGSSAPGSWSFTVSPSTPAWQRTCSTTVSTIGPYSTKITSETRPGVPQLHLPPCSFLTAAGRCLYWPSRLHPRNSTGEISEPTP